MTIFVVLNVFKLNKDSKYKQNANTHRNTIYLL